MTVESPVIREQIFRKLDAALDYCKFAQPEEIHISQIQTSDGTCKWILQFVGSKGSE